VLAERIDTSLTLQDRVRFYLESYGSREIPITIEQLSKDLERPEASVYQVINSLRKNNEIELEKEIIGNGREKIVGVKLIRLQPSGRTYRRSVERSGPVVRVMPSLDSVSVKDTANLDGLIGYLEKKLALEDMKKRALEAGLDESVITFEPDEIAEEGILLLKLYTELKQEHQELQAAYQMQGFDLDAEKRNVVVLKARLREETDQMLREET
jgi:hypothetical protein